MKKFLAIFLLLLTSTAFGATYHIAPESGGGGSEDGSYTNPYDSWSDLPSMSTSDDVYFLCGETYTASSTMYIGWDGTVSDPAIVGAYYMSGGSPVYDVSGDRPIISGNNWAVPSNVCYGSSDSWSGLIRVNNHDYVHILNLHVYQPGFYGIYFQGDLGESAANENFLIQGCKVEDSYMSGIQINTSKYNYGVIEDTEVVGHNIGWYNCPLGNWGAGISVSNSPYAYTTIRNNYVHEGWGEGISSTRIFYSSSSNNCGYVTIEDNIVYNNRRVDIYLCTSSYNVVRRNVLLGANDSVYSSTTADGRPWNQMGIWVNNEYRNSALPNESHNNQVYNNFIAGHYTGLGIASYYSSGTMTDQQIHHNTLVGNYQNWSIGSTLTGYTTSDIDLNNNISYCPADTTCVDYNNDYSWFDSKITADYNAWDGGPPTYMGGSNDVTTGDFWTKLTGWQALTGPITDVDDLMPTSSNPTVDSGTALSSPYNTLIADTSILSATPSDILIHTVLQSGSIQMGAVSWGGSGPQPPPEDTSSFYFDVNGAEFIFNVTGTEPVFVQN